LESAVEFRVDSDKTLESATDACVPPEAPLESAVEIPPAEILTALESATDTFTPTDNALLSAIAGGRFTALLSAVDVLAEIATAVLWAIEIAIDLS
jgi:hypothetical protein